jgi:hypothetical protein
MFELDDFVLDAEFLAFQIGDRFDVRRGSGDFLTQRVFQAAMKGSELFDTV